jgi:hypothetical protein
MLISYVSYTSWLKKIRFYVEFFITYLIFISLSILHAFSRLYKTSFYRFLETIIQLLLEDRFYT